MKKFILSLLLGIMIIFLLFYLLGLYFLPIFERVYTEIERFPSPDKKVEAVLVHSDAGATTALATHIYVVPAGHQIDYEEEICVFDAEHVEGLNVQWQENTFLVIQYGKAEIYGFRNRGYPFSEDYKYYVEIREVPLREKTFGDD